MPYAAVWKSKLRRPHAPDLNLQVGGRVRFTRTTAETKLSLHGPEPPVSAVPSNLPFQLGRAAPAKGDGVGESVMPIGLTGTTLRTGGVRGKVTRYFNDLMRFDPGNASAIGGFVHLSSIAAPYQSKKAVRDQPLPVGQHHPVGHEIGLLPALHQHGRDARKPHSSYGDR